MNDFLPMVASTPLPIVLLLLGLLFLFISIGGHFTTGIDTTRVKPIPALVIGLFLSFSGGGLQFY